MGVVLKIKSVHILYEQGRFKEAEIAYQKALEIRPDYIEVLINLANTQLKNGKPNEAEIAYQKALGIRPDYVEILINLANTQLKNGKPNEAEIAYKKALEIRPDYVEAHYNLGIMLVALGRLEEAEIAYKKALEIRPDYVEAHYNLGNMLVALGRLEEAEIAYQKTLEIKPNYVEAIFNYSQERIFSNQNNVAKGLLQNLISIDQSALSLKAGVNLAVLNYLENSIVTCEEVLVKCSAILKKDITGSEYEISYWIYINALIKWHQNNKLQSAELKK